MQHTPVPVRSELHGPWNLAALVVAVLAGDHQIDGHQNAAQTLLEPHGLVVAAGQLRLHHQQIDGLAWVMGQKPAEWSQSRPSG